MMEESGMVEEWRDVVGYEGLYWVSSLGRVRSSYRQRRILSLAGLDATGYPVVSLTKDGVRHTYTVHRLVCRAFHGEPSPDKPETAHLDGSKTNCRADNLRWVTKLENETHKQVHGTDQKTIGAKRRAGMYSAAPGFPITRTKKQPGDLELVNSGEVGKMVRVRANG